MDQSKLHWWSDWNGDEVGYNEVSIVGLYSLKDFPVIYVYINTATGEILESWTENDN